MNASELRTFVKGDSAILNCKVGIAAGGVIDVIVSAEYDNELGRMEVCDTTNNIFMITPNDYAFELAKS